MPELPEIENIAKSLRQKLLGRRIVTLAFSPVKLRKPYPTDINNLQGALITKVYRIAKYLCLELNLASASKEAEPQIRTIIWHFGMTGRLHYINQTNLGLDGNLSNFLHPNCKHNHIIIVTNNHKEGYNEELRTPPYILVTYHDTRRFGSFEVIEGRPNKIELGVEPLTEEFSSSYLYKKSSKSSSMIKNIIMNNKIVVGVGNIYACESLWHAKIIPTKLGRDCTLEEISFLVDKIKDVLNRAILAGGSTIKDYRIEGTSKGNFQLEHQVYGKEHKKCPRCSGIIHKTVIAGRATYYCCLCQR